MTSTIKNIFILIAGIMIAAIISFIIISLGHLVITPPLGMDTNDFESIKSNFHLFQTKHFVFPLIGHAISTFSASYFVSRYTDNNKLWFALGIGILFTILSTVMSIRIGQFNWISIVEIGHYIPVSFLGFKFWQKSNSKEGS